MQDTHAPLAWVGRKSTVTSKAINAHMACILGCYCATTENINLATHDIDK
jgi:hypothetical protein